MQSNLDVIVALYFFYFWFRSDHKEFNNQTKIKQNAENVCAKNWPNDDRSSMRNNLFKTRFYADLSGFFFLNAASFAFYSIYSAYLYE